jgi:hypothetical protein
MERVVYTSHAKLRLKVRGIGEREVEGVSIPSAATLRCLWRGRWMELK